MWYRAGKFASPRSCFKLIFSEGANHKEWRRMLGQQSRSEGSSMIGSPPGTTRPCVRWRGGFSRGSESADFVEFRPASLHALRANVAVLRMRDRTRIFKRDAVQFAAALEADAYDLAFVDPPYESRQLDLVLESWQATGFSRVLVAEHARGHALPRSNTRLDFDETVVSIYRRAAGANR